MRKSLIGLMFALTACSPPAAPTVDYYRAHLEERESKMRECANDPGSLRSTAACVNAREAARIDGVGTLERLPPMGLGRGSQLKPADSGSR